MKNKICICIAAFKRPDMFREVLQHVAALQVPPDSELLLVVVDNDAAQSSKVAFDCVQFPFAAIYAVEPQEGIPFSTNKTLDIAVEKGSTHVLFGADDLLFPPDYAVKLLAFMNRNRADVVRGKMVTIDDDGKRSTVRRASLFSRQDLVPGNGALMTRKLFGDWNLRYNLEYMTGLHDADFFYRAYLRGARLYNVEDAIFEEYRPASRGGPTNLQEQLTWDMHVRRDHVFLRRRAGGLWRGLVFALRQGLPILFLQIPANVLLLPFAPKQRAIKIIRLFYKLAGLSWGLWMREIPAATTQYTG